MLAEIASIFEKVKYGQIVFHISPESRTLNYSFSNSGKILIEEKLKKPGMVLDKYKK
jgi:hypothetical protein